MLSSRKYYHRILQSNVKLQFLLMVGENYVRSKTIIREFAVMYIGDYVEGHVQHLLDPSLYPSFPPGIAS